MTLAVWLGFLVAAIVIAVTINSSPTKQGKHDEAKASLAEIRRR